MSVSYIFPSFIARKRCNFHTEKIVDHLYSLREKDPEGLKVSNAGGWHSSYLVEDKKILFYLKDLIPNIKELTDEIGLSVNGINLHTMWSTINPPGSYNLSHVHAMCNLSGVLYLKVPSNSGSICFDNQLDNCGLFDKMKNQEFTGSFNTYNVAPEPNMLLLFHPNQRHYVENNNSLEDRISISFNITLF